LNALQDEISLEHDLFVCIWVRNCNDSGASSVKHWRELQHRAGCIVRGTAGLDC
jgi:hypothetical protein